MSTNGLIGTSFIPPPTTTHAETTHRAPRVIGIFDIVGTIAAGLTDKSTRANALRYYFLRGLSLLVVPVLLGPQSASLFL